MRISLRICLSCAVALTTVGVCFADDSDKSISIKVRDTVVRSKPKAWAPGVSQVAYGNKVTVIGSESGWLKVRTSSGKEGYLHPSAVTDKPVILSSPKGGVGKEVDPSEVVLAGKGFSKEIEQQYAALNPALKFGELNQIERVRISDSELVEFMRQGMLGKGRL